MKLNINQRNITPEDIQPIYELGVDGFTWPSESILWNKPLVQWYFEFGNQFSFVATYNEMVIGFILCSASNLVGYVGWICVDAKMRRQHIATQLLHRAVLTFQVRGIRSVTSIVRDDGITNRLFELAGFRDSGLRKTDVILDLKHSSS